MNEIQAEYEDSMTARHLMVENRTQNNNQKGTGKKRQLNAGIWVLALEHTS
jgi:hypothetical protein